MHVTDYASSAWPTSWLDDAKRRAPTHVMGVRLLSVPLEAVRAHVHPLAIVSDAFLIPVRTGAIGDRRGAVGPHHPPPAHEMAVLAHDPPDLPGTETCLHADLAVGCDTAAGYPFAGLEDALRGVGKLK